MKREVLVGLTLVVAVFILSGCFSTQEAEIAPPTPHFSWEPPGKEVDQKIAIALVHPSLGRESRLADYQNDKFIRLFMDNLLTDLNRTLIAKGFTVTGPFGSLDEMTFPEKKASPLALYPEVDLVFNVAWARNETKPLPGSLDNSRSVEKTGTLSASGVVRFSMVEPLSAQKMWIKKVDVPQETATIEVDLLMNGRGTLNRFHKNRDNSQAVVVDVLNKAYPVIMQKFWGYLNAEEIRGVKKSAEDARARKVF